MDEAELRVVNLVWEAVGLLGPILDAARANGLIPDTTEARLADLVARLTEASAAL